MDVRSRIQRDIFEETLRLFDKAAAEGLAESGKAADDMFLDEIRRNNAVFSAFRTHRMQNDLASRLLDEDGNLKSFDRWVRDIRGMTSHYCGSWLRTEYDTAVIRAHRAADWRHFEDEADVFPNVRWMPTTSPNQDPLHRQYWEARLTLPVNHPFWNDHRPGDRWNCKCSLRQTDEPADDSVIRKFYPVKAQPGLDNNPAADGKLFSDSHPYYTKAYPGAEKAAESMALKKQIEEIIIQVKETFPTGRAVKIGNLEKSVLRFIEKRGMTPVSDEIFVTDHRIGHALRDSKVDWGKAVSPEHLSDALSDLGRLEVYWDEKQKGLWYVETVDGTTNKYVFKINEKIKVGKKKIITNTFVTAGIIDKRNLSVSEIIKIK